MRIAATLLLLTLLAGCTPAGLNAWLDDRLKNFQLLEFDQTGKNSRAAIVQALDADDHLHAFELLLAEKRRGRSETAYAKAWTRALNGLIVRAERDYRRREFSSAGILYHRIEQNLPEDAQLRATLDLDQPGLHARVDDCADRILETGMLAYRNGNLEEALEIWSDINRFHPTHKASQRAIRTTRLQLQNLEALPASSS